jgi:hypothetical protein
VLGLDRTDYFGVVGALQTKKEILVRNFAVRPKCVHLFIDLGRV